MFEPKTRINAKVAQCYYRAWILLKDLQNQGKSLQRSWECPACFPETSSRGRRTLVSDD